MVKNNDMTPVKRKTETLVSKIVYWGALTGIAFVTVCVFGIIGAVTWALIRWLGGF